jgi:hypothetical protein
MIEFFGMNGEPITQVEWQKLIGSRSFDRHVGFTDVPQDDGSADTVRVSTVWVGINIGLPGNKLIFETMVFGGVHDSFRRLYETREEAKLGHEDVVVLVGGKREEACQAIQKPLFSEE